MTAITKQQLINYFIALVWLINGLFCKVLHLVPRHQEIVAAILGQGPARLFTLLIGISETFMALWILSGRWRKLNAVVQIVVVATMNTIEYILVPDLLLWGRFNSVWAVDFIILICYNTFRVSQKLKTA